MNSTEEVSSFAEDSHWMREALREAERAGRRGEVPVGAVVVGAGRVLGRAGNAIEATQDPTAHAEMLALRQAAAALGTRRLLATTLYSLWNLAPCVPGRGFSPSATVGLRGHRS